VRKRRDCSDSGWAKEELMQTRPWMPLMAAIVLAVAMSSSHAETGKPDTDAEAAAAKLLEQRMKNASPEDLAILRAVKGKEIVVVRGSMDKIERVLRAARIPHTVINPAQVARADLMADQIVMVNCPGRMPAAGVRRLRKFVAAGGLLYTTDWALKNVIERAFPRTIAHNGRSTGNHVTEVQVHHHENNMMSNMLLRDQSKPQWWLEGGSYPIKLLDPQRVKVLAMSKEMKRRYGAGPIVVRFGWEDGEVIHVVSHFYRQMKTRGQQVASKQLVGQIKGLSAAQRKSYAQSGAGKVSMSEVESSYAFQQMTSNMVVGKRRRNAKLDRAYGYQSKAPLRIEGRKAPKGARLKVLEKKGKKVRVRDDRGNKAWVDEDLLEAR
jgi:hypothetical protein